MHTELTVELDGLEFIITLQYFHMELFMQSDNLLLQGPDLVCTLPGLYLVPPLGFLILFGTATLFGDTKLLAGGGRFMI